ncbi:uncharacterized protein LOC131250789 [Magnolia sinica]|uniref:uncharacterized protein LOC131250789 n=1 Tax=Magnolia sinica TaxID=86752 RepID=UPI0026583965|nr:uncharacterized protein LOC131250789 [Magnolia sinica]
MGKSSKKSNTPVAATPMAISPVKSVKKGKRHPELIEKQSAAKKLKREVEEAVEKQKNDKKSKASFEVAPKKPETSSSKDVSLSKSEEEDMTSKRASRGAPTSETSAAPTVLVSADQLLQMLQALTAILQGQDRRPTDTPAQTEQERATSLLLDFMWFDPPRFHGEPDPIAAERWRSEVEKIFDTMRCTTQQRVRLAVFLLQGDAEHWWASVTRVARAEFEWTWEDFVERFDRKFFPEHVRHQLELEFQTLVQGNMTVSQYEARFIALSRFATYFVDDEGRKAHRFQNGLRPGLRSRVVGHMLSTFEEVVERAQIYEAEWNDAQRIRDQRGEWKRKAPSGSSQQQQLRPLQRRTTHPFF